MLEYIKDILTREWIERNLTEKIGWAIAGLIVGAIAARFL